MSRPLGPRRALTRSRTGAMCLGGPESGGGEGASREAWKVWQEMQEAEMSFLLAVVRTVKAASLSAQSEAGGLRPHSRVSPASWTGDRAPVRHGPACARSERRPAGSRGAGPPLGRGRRTGRGALGQAGVRPHLRRTPGRPGSALGGRDPALGGAWGGTGREGPAAAQGPVGFARGGRNPASGGPRRWLPERSSRFLLPARPHPHLELSPPARDGGGHVIRANMATAAAGS